MQRTSIDSVVFFGVLLFSICTTCDSSDEHAPDSITSDFEDPVNEVCSDKGGKCDTGNSPKTVAWKPFRISGENKWIAFHKLTESYAEWHRQVLFDDSIPCNEKKILAFTPNAGLGDSVGALTTAYMYAMRSGRLFFIDWKPFAWSLAFQDLPFYYEYQKAFEARSESNKPLICPDGEDEASYLSGHITARHPLAKEAKAVDFHTDYSHMMAYFLQPSDDVQKIIDRTVKDSFQNAHETTTVLHKVAIVMRTGIGEYNQFLSEGDEKNFVTCFRNYADKFQQKQERKKRHSKFVVFVTSDNSKAKQAVVDSLKSLDKSDIDVDVVTLEDSAIHVMHMSREDSERDKVRVKLWKTIAEFFLIGRCDVRFLTHGSLFGRVAAERGGGPEESNFFLSDSNCDGHRDKYSYLECHSPKYPPICGLS